MVSQNETISHFSALFGAWCRIHSHFTQGVFMKLSLFVALATAFLGSDGHAAFQVHEWGTFTSLVGSDGQPQSDMYSEDEALPEFVHSFGENRRPSLTKLADPEPCIPRGKVPCEFLVGQNITQKM